MSTYDIYEYLETGKIKRYFRVNKKLVVKNGIYHVTQRAPGNDVIFVEKNDYLYFLKSLKDVVKKFNLHFFAFALLTNHLHLLFQLVEENLPAAMKALFENYAVYFNRKYKRKGHVFGGRYRATLCNDELYLIGISLYIHLNPYKAGLADKITNYRWTSLFPYLHTVGRKPFFDYKFILKIIDANLQTSRKTYWDLLKNSARVNYPNLVEDPNLLEGFIGHTFSFMKSLRLNINHDEVSLRNKLSVLRSVKRARSLHTIKARQYVIEQMLARGFKVKEICAELGLTRQALYKFTKEVVAKMST